MKITFVRHTSVNVPRGVCYGQTDVPLSDTFTQEAEIIHNKLRSITENEPFDEVYTSPLSRCTHLADYCGYPYAIRDRRLLELDFGEWEMIAFDENKDERLQLWYDDYIHVAPTGGESFIMQYQRVSNFLEEIKKKTYNHVLVFAHGGVLICAQIFAGLINIEEGFSRLPVYGECVEIII